MMNWINEFSLNPGVYEHYKGGLYIVQNIITHHKSKGTWAKLRDPMVVYRSLEATYKKVNIGKNPDGTPNIIRREIIKTFMRPLSEFIEIVEVKGENKKRFTHI